MRPKIHFFFLQNVPAANNDVIYNLSLSGEAFSKSHIDKNKWSIKILLLKGHE